MKKLVASILALALTFALAPINLGAAARFQTGSIAGTATANGKPLTNVTVRVRNVDTGQLVGTQQVGANGAFNFTGLGPGNFVVETVSSNGTILGVSTPIALAAGAAVTGVTVAASAAAMAAAGGAGAAAAGGAAAGAGGAAGGGAAAGGAAAATGGAFFGTTAGILTLSAIGVGAAAGLVVANTGS